MKTQKVKPAGVADDLPPVDLNATPYWWKVFEPIRGGHGIESADGWCGFGMGTQSLIESCLKRNWYIKHHTAVNHWSDAVLLHAKNYPGACHFNAKMEQISPNDLAPHGYLDMFTAGFKCQPFSRAAGGKERQPQERLDPWEIIRIMSDIFVKTFVGENVPEFVEFGPISADGYPLKSKKGEYFRAWLAALSVNHTVKYKVLTACYYGDPQARSRLWIIAKRDKRRVIYFPEPTHRDPNAPADMFNAHLPTWPVARDIIDWNLPTQSIFGSLLVPNTLARILAGADKFAGLRLEFPALPGCPPLPTKKKRKGARVSPYAQSAWNLHYLNCALVLSRGGKLQAKNRKIIKQMDSEAIEIARNVQRFYGERQLDIKAGSGVVSHEGYLVKLYGTNVTASLDKALPTATTSNHLGFVMINRGGSDGYERNSDLDESVPALTTAPAASVVEVDQSFLFAHNTDKGGAERVRSVDVEFPTVVRRGAGDLATVSYIIPQASMGSPHSVGTEMPTVLSDGAHRKVDVILPPEGIFRGNAPRSVDREMPTLTQRGGGSVIEYLISGEHVSNGDDRVRSADSAMPTLTGTPDWRIAATFLTGYHNCDKERVMPVTEALDTVDTSNRYLAAFIAAYYGSEVDGQSTDEALRTVPTRDRFLLVIANRWKFDIRTRMLAVKELAAAQSVPKAFNFKGVTAEKAKKMIGNCWAKEMGTAVVDAAFD